MLLLAGLAREAELLHVLRSMLQPRDYACLVAISRRAVSSASYSIRRPLLLPNLNCDVVHYSLQVPRQMMGEAAH